MAKEFKTIGELVLLLESRGVKTDEDTPVILKRERFLDRFPANVAASA